MVNFFMLIKEVEGTALRVGTENITDLFKCP
jgi:hypothetical protein